MPWVTPFAIFSIHKVLYNHQESEQLMSRPALTLSKIKQAVAEGRQEELSFQRVELEASQDCALHCGVPTTLSLEGVVIAHWPSDVFDGVVLQLEEVSFKTPTGARHRDDAFVHVRTNPPSPTLSGE
jgi:hypothetical protein